MDFNSHHMVFVFNMYVKVTDLYLFYYIVSYT